MIAFIITLLIVLYRIPLINLLGDKGMGYYSVALVVYLLFMTCIAYGLPKALSTMITMQKSKGEYGSILKTVQSAFVFIIISSGISAVLLFVFSDWICTYLLGASYSSYALRIFSLCLILISILGVFHGVFTGTKLSSVSKKVRKTEEFFVAILSILGTYLFLMIGENIASQKGNALLKESFGAFGAAFGLTLGILIACILAFVHFRNTYKKIKRLSQKNTEKKDKPTKTIIHNLVLTMLPIVSTLIVFHLSSLLDYSIFNRIMSVQGHKENSYIILLGMLNGKYEFFVSLPLLLVNWFAVSQTPVFHKIAQDGSKKKMQIKIGQNLRGVMLYIIPCTLIYIVFSLPLMNLLFSGNNDTPSMLLKTGALSIVFYSLAAISNAALTALDEWACVTKNAIYSLVIQVVFLLIMMIVFQWGIVAVVTSRIIFSAALFIFNEHSLRERTGYIQEHKRTFTIPLMSSTIMIIFSLLIYIISKIFVADKFAVIIAIFIGIPVYIMALVFLGGITQGEMYRLPGGKYLAPLCRKLHLTK